MDSYTWEIKDYGIPNIATCASRLMGNFVECVCSFLTGIDDEWTFTWEETDDELRRSCNAC